MTNTLKEKILSNETKPQYGSTVDPETLEWDIRAMNEAARKQLSSLPEWIEIKERHSSTNDPSTTTMITVQETGYWHMMAFWRGISKEEVTTDIERLKKKPLFQVAGAQPTLYKREAFAQRPDVYPDPDKAVQQQDEWMRQHATTEIWHSNGKPVAMVTYSGASPDEIMRPPWEESWGPIVDPRLANSNDGFFEILDQSDE